MKISTVVPLFNEEESLETLYQELSAVCETNQYEAQFVFVDDGSSDQSWAKVEQLAQSDDRVLGVRLRRNFGKAAALSAGFSVATGEIIVTLDADLQDDPKEIPRFVEQMEQGKDVVSGWKKVRHDPYHKRYPSKVFNWLVCRLTGVSLHDHNCGFKSYRREIFDEVRLYGELHRFVPVLAASRGWTVGEIVVEHRARQHGKSKYGVSRFVKGFLDLMTVYFITGFRQRPQHLLGTIGLTSFMAGSLGMIYLAIYWIVRVSSADLQAELPPVHQRPLLLYSIGAMLLGAQLLCIGFLAELVIANSADSKRPYSVKSTIGGAVERRVEFGPSDSAIRAVSPDNSQPDLCRIESTRGYVQLSSNDRQSVVRKVSIAPAIPRRCGKMCQDRHTMRLVG